MVIPWSDRRNQVVKTVVGCKPVVQLRDSLTFFVAPCVFCRLTLHKLRFLFTAACVCDHHGVAHIETPIFSDISNQAHLVIERL